MKLYDEVRHKLRLLHYAIDTEHCYLRWINQFVRFHKKGDVWKHPNSMREAEIEEFLSYLAVDRQVAASTQNQAFTAILFLYEKVLEIKLERIDALRAQRKKRTPFQWPDRIFLMRMQFLTPSPHHPSTSEVTASPRAFALSLHPDSFVQS